MVPPLDFNETSSINTGCETLKGHELQLLPSKVMIFLIGLMYIVI